MTKATLTFLQRSQAEQFCTAWTFYSKRGHTLGSGKENVKVTLHNVTDDNKQWIDNYAKGLNQ